MGRMTQAIEDRIYGEADYIIEHNCTIREAAKHFKVSKSTVCNDMLKQLETLDQSKYLAVRVVIQFNLDQRAYRAGRATRMHWLRKKAQMKGIK